MDKLYPPSIEGVIPAFYGDRLTVPFVMNKTVSWNEVDCFVLKVKNIHNNMIVDTLFSIHKDDNDKIVQDFSKNTSEAYFTIDSNKFNIGQSYKL